MEKLGMGNSFRNIYRYVSLFIMAVIIMAPIYILITTAFKTSAEMQHNLPYAFPSSLYVGNFINALKNGVIARGYLNTLFILVLSLILCMFFGTSVAYVIARFDFRLKKLIMGLYTVSIIIPGATTQVINFSTIKNLGVMGTPWALVLLYCGTDIVQLFIFLQFIRNIPSSLDEAALVEGAGYFTIYRKVILPLIVPAIVTASIIKIVAVYNDVYLPYLYMPQNVTLSTALMRFTSTAATDYKLVSAATIVGILPVIIIYLLFQRFIIAGVVQGSVKE